MSRPPGSEFAPDRIATELADARTRITELEAALDLAEKALGPLSCWQHRCSDGIGGCMAISESARNTALAALRPETEKPTAAAVLGVAVAVADSLPPSESPAWKNERMEQLRKELRALGVPGSESTPTSGGTEL